jgi:hypothetical protein
MTDSTDEQHHVGIVEGRRYAMPGKGTDPDDYRFEQYADLLDNPAQISRGQLDIPRTARFFEYEIKTLNIPGPLPRAQGLPPFKDPYGYGWEDLDEWGRLGKFDWTMRTQMLPITRPFPLHRACIPLNTKYFDFDPRVHLVESPGPRANLYTLPDTRLRALQQCGTAILHCMIRIEFVAQELSLTLPSARDTDWHFGQSWIATLERGSRPSPPWRIAHVAQELRRRLMDGLGFVMMGIRFLIYFRLYRRRLTPPNFRTTTLLAGLMVAPHDERSRLIGESLAQLGIPVWTIHSQNFHPSIEMYPRGSTEDSPLWRRARNQVYDRYPPRNRDEEVLRRRIQERFQSLLQDAGRRNHVQKPMEVWVMSPGHATQAPGPGPFYRSFKSNFREPTGDEHETYAQRMVRWLSSTRDWHQLTVLKEMQAVLGEETISLQPLADRFQFDPPLPIFHQNYATCKDWAREEGGDWIEPPAFPALEPTLPLAERLVNPQVRSHGEPPSLLPRLSDDILYPSRRRETRVASRAPTAQASSSTEDPALESYEMRVDSPPPAFVDYSAPDEPMQDSPQSPSPSPAPRDSDVDWDDWCVQNSIYPVRLAPFLYFDGEKKLEEELVERYGSHVNSWFQGLQSIVLGYTDRNRALLMVENQRAAALLYPAEPFAGAMHPDAIPGTLQAFSPRCLAEIANTVQARGRARLERFPIPPLAQAVSARGRLVTLDRPADTKFAMEDLTKLFYGNEAIPSHTRGSSSRLMSRYSLPAVAFMDILRDLRLKEEENREAAVAPWLSNASTFQSLLERHLSFRKPHGFSLPLPTGHVLQELLSSIARSSPAVSPTSLLARGTYDREYFKWSGTREVYEIVLDDVEPTSIA